MERFFKYTIIMAILFYICGAFIWSSFDVSKWDAEGKGIIVFFFLFCSFVAGIGPAGPFKSEDNE